MGGGHLLALTLSKRKSAFPQHGAGQKPPGLVGDDGQIAAEHGKVEPLRRRTRYYTWNNTNALLGSYKGVTGIKTGTTSKAGACLVFSAERDGKTLTGVVLNGKDRNEDAVKLLDYGFGADEASDMKLRKPPSDAQSD